MIPVKIVGVLEAFAEQCTEGIRWTVIDNAMIGYASLNPVEDGDYLFVEDGNGNIEWEGAIHLDYEMNRRPHSFHPTGTWQRVQNCTVHGLQSNVEPTVWFDWFTSNRPAVLIKGENVVSSARKRSI